MEDNDVVEIMENIMGIGVAGYNEGSGGVVIVFDDGSDSEVFPYIDIGYN